jgi:hypothetical protein
VLLALFNNLLAPLLAEMFVSSDCFLYIVTQAPALKFSYNEYFCQSENTVVNSFEVCNIRVLITQGYGTPVNIAIIPPFHYSYQCSFSLISSYSYVFIFRYIISGVLEPLIKGMLINYYTATPSHRIRDFIFKAPPTLWQNVLLLTNVIHDREAFTNRLNYFEKQIKKGVIRRLIVVLLVTDLTMLICFGSLFPPLAVIIALSVLKDVMSIKLALGRYCEIMEAVQDESLKEQMVKVKEAMDEEMLRAVAGIWNGMWYGMVISTWIWGFVLFDTMASVEGVEKGLCVLIGMIVSPFIIRIVLQLAARLNAKFTIQSTALQGNNDANLTTTMNPIFNEDRHIEMVNSKLTKNRMFGK